MAPAGNVFCYFSRGRYYFDVCRRILLDQFHDSGRYYVDLDEIIGNKIPEHTYQTDIEKDLFKPLFLEIFFVTERNCSKNHSFKGDNIVIGQSVSILEDPTKRLDIPIRTRVNQIYTVVNPGS